MEIGMIGLGKLGLPVAVAIAEKGHDVYGYDVNSECVARYRAGTTGLYEPGIDDRLRSCMDKLHFLGSVQEVCDSSGIIFIVVQTPHPPELDGSVRSNHVRKDFDYTFLINAVREIGSCLRGARDHKTIAVISTVLPGTMREIVYPVMKREVDREIGEGWGLCYNPSFIAMGTTIQDFVAPEFTIIGDYSRAEASLSARVLCSFYDTIHLSPKLRMSWEEAECVKMFYNTFIGVKVVFANTIMQICSSLPEANCDTVTETLTMAQRRLISPKYLRGGMGDGGPCHPRDNLALAYLSDRLGLDYNLFDFVMTVREKQAEALANLMCKYPGQKVILGKTYKPGTNLTAGSPSLLIANILKEKGVEVVFHDPVTDPEPPAKAPSVYLIATAWPEFQDFDYFPGSVVIDPWRIIKEVPAGVELVSLGVGPSVTRVPVG